MPSRLDRLFSLLETGTTSVTRKAAAAQLGEFVRLHSPELAPLLDRLHNYIISKSWDTRVAAGCAIRAIAENYPLQIPVPVDPISDCDELDVDLDSLTLSSFNIKNVLKNGTYLSSGNEGQFDVDTSAVPADRIKEQRGLINESLGLGPGGDTRGIVTNDDLVILADKTTDNGRKQPVYNVVQKEIACLESSSCIQRCRRSVKRPLMSNSDNEEQSAKRTRLTEVDCKLSIDDQHGDSPFAVFCDVLAEDLFNASWETRHGAALALREIVHVQGNVIGKRSGCTRAEMYNDNRIWLEDKAVRTLSVIGMDRFVDFVSDDAVAPVRESCSQLLGALVKFMSEKSIIQIQDMIHEMIQWDDWGTRHGGMLALKYIIAVRSGMKKILFIQSYPHIFLGLKDSVDDVIAEAASCFMPVSNEVSSILDEEQLDNLLSTLWNSLLEFDGLSGALTSILDLLSNIFKHSVITEKMTLDAAKHVPNLFPFMYETSHKMRASSLQTILSLLNGKFVQSASSSSHMWLSHLIEPLMIHVFQSLIIESHVENMDTAVRIWDNILTHSHSSKVQAVAIKHYATWMSQLASYPRATLESSYFKVPTLECQKVTDTEEKNDTTNKKYMLGCGHNVVSNDKHMYRTALQAKLYGSKLLGNLANYAVLVSDTEYPPGEAPIDCFYRLLLTYLTSQSAWARHIGVSVLSEWAIQHSVTCPTLKDHLLKALSESVYYDEVAWSCAKLQRDAKNFIAVLDVYSIQVGKPYEDLNILSLEQITELTGSFTKELIAGSKIRKQSQKQLEERREELIFMTAEVSKNIVEYNMLVQSSVSSAMVALNMYPDKLTPLVKPLMDSIRREEVEFIQDISASSLPKLMSKCSDRELCPNSKIFKNLGIFLCVDETVTPFISQSDVPANYGIYCLNQQEEVAKRNLARCSSATGRPVGRPRTNSSTSVDASYSTRSDEPSADVVQRRGCSKALINIVKYFGPRLKTDLKFFYDSLLNPLKEKTTPIIESSADAITMVQWFQLLEIILPYLPQNILDEFLDHIHSLSLFLFHKFSIIRHMASRVFATLTKERKDPCMLYMVQHILPNLDLPPTDSCILMKEGILEYMYMTIEKLQLDILPFIVLLIVPLLAGMSDNRKSIRQMSTQCFSTLIRIYPLDRRSSESSLMPNYLVDKIQEQRAFLDQLCDPSTLNTFEIRVKINANLRPYQQRGVDWLAFLNRYNLHGILCDDMGLGKTLQSICILAADHHAKKLAREGEASSGSIKSLIICPSTLTAHWYYEFKKFVSPTVLNPIDYSGLPYERKRLRDQIDNHDVIIASYKIVRNEIDDFFSTIKWNYVILDEGHIIKNGKTKASMAIKTLEARHRLILTGTPIQNNVLELWSLFDFLMPGYLGSERQFNANYSRPILQSREPKASSRDQEAGVLAMETLHRQTLPFLLRRIKEHVLNDLPPKITQDYYCELSPLQKTLYEDFVKQPSCQQSLSPADKPGQSYIFQSLQYLKRVCNHPKLAITPSHPKFTQINSSLKKEKSSLCDIKHSAKMTALKQLLVDCGIGASDETSCSYSVLNPIVSPHRALIFCQLKEMIDIIETDLLKSHLPSVTYIRMDGSVPINLRHGIVQRFNSDPSIDLLLLTTQVGGLGLNLTGADTVIFVEHDWNPMRDLQAMDRAHRIGQKRAVNVYRLITKRTIEEKIMNLQKFKLMVANTVINEDNTSLVKMGTDQLLDLFTLNQGEAPAIKDGSSDKRQTSISSVLANLPELWDEGQYSQEYNFDAFLKTLPN